jgi:acyl carrier protein
MATGEQAVGDVVTRYLVDTILDGDGRGLDRETDLIAGGLLDSFAVVQLVSFLEEHFQVEVPRDKIDAEHFRTIGSVTELMVHTVNGQDAGARLASA